MCLFGVGGAGRRPHRASSLTISTSDCAVLLRSWRTKRSGIIRKMPLSMRAPSVAPCGAVPWVPSNEVQRGNGIGETHEERGCFHFKELQQKHITTALITKKALATASAFLIAMAQLYYFLFAFFSLPRPLINLRKPPFLPLSISTRPSRARWLMIPIDHAAIVR